MTVNTDDFFPVTEANQNFSKVSRAADNGVRDMGLLESALQSAYATFDGKELYPTKEEKAARLGVGLVSNHAFVDGNKRIGMYAEFL